VQGLGQGEQGLGQEEQGLGLGEWGLVQVEQEYCTWSWDIGLELVGMRIYIEKYSKILQYTV
jgi:hypothetical protein